MSVYRVLVDSSVWINYFKTGGLFVLDRLIEEDLVCINEIIFTELAPVLQKQGEKTALEGLAAIERLPLNIDWRIIRKYQLMNLNNGVNKIGIPDLIIVQQVIHQNISLLSFDKHFKLMQNHIDLELFDINQ